MRSHERLYFYLTTQSIKFFFYFYFETYFCFTCRFTAPSLTCTTSNLLLNGLGSQHSGVQVASKLPRVWHLLSMLGFTSDSPQISASPHQMDLCTLRFEVIQCSMECPEASPWQAHVAFESYPRKNEGWGNLSGVMATIALSSGYGSKSA